MPRKKERTVIDDLADKADEMLGVCWQKLKARDVTPADIEKMVEGWRLKHEVFAVKEEEKQLKQREDT